MPIMLVRLNADGSYDATFGNQGQVLLPEAVAGSFDVVGTFLDQNQGLTLVGNRYDRMSILHIQRDGALASHVLNGPLTTLDAQCTPFAVHPLPNGSMLLGGSASEGSNWQFSDFCVTKLIYRDGFGTYIPLITR
ncbi:MAG: hypothetical protein AB4911_22610 [Oscillochloridaceae bacterium umkhey_bin13]